MKPTKILKTPSWGEGMHIGETGVYYDDAYKNMPITDYILRRGKEISDKIEDKDQNVNAWKEAGNLATLGVLAPLGIVADGIGNIGTTAVNGYKKIYNAGADLANKAKLELIDKQIKDFQKNNPNKNALPVGKKFEYKSAADKVKDAGAATDSEVWEATHEFGYGNDPRTVYRRLRYRKQQVNPKPRISL